MTESWSDQLDLRSCPAPSPLDPRLDGGRLDHCAAWPRLGSDSAPVCWISLMGSAGLPIAPAEGIRNPWPASTCLKSCPRISPAHSSALDFHRYCEIRAICPALRNLSISPAPQPRTLVITAPRLAPQGAGGVHHACSICPAHGAGDPRPASKHRRPVGIAPLPDARAARPFRSG